MIYRPSWCSDVADGNMRSYNDLVHSYGMQESSCVQGTEHLRNVLVVGDFSLTSGCLLMAMPCTYVRFLSKCTFVWHCKTEHSVI